jgi:hypothetical protein
MRKTIFGEGAERMVHKFRFLDQSRGFTGPKMVAKESRFLQDKYYEERLKYHTSFCRTQAIASQIAAKFNEALDAVDEHTYGGRLRSVPRIEFLTPMVVSLVDESGDWYCVLVEKQLPVDKYTKFNNNMGYVMGHGRDGELEALMGNLQIDAKKALGAIEEADDDDDDDDDDDEGEAAGNSDRLFDSKMNAPDPLWQQLQIFDMDVPQAFSHFSFVNTKRTLLVCDLQGVLSAGHPRKFELTDPVIHKKAGRLQSWFLGRTDRAKKGFRAFFETHKCNDLCKALGLYRACPRCQGSGKGLRGVSCSICDGRGGKLAHEGP